MICHQYKVSKGQWGIFIDLYGEVCDYANVSITDKEKNLFAVNDCIHVLFTPEKQSEYEYVNLCQEDYPFLLQGIANISNLIEKYSKYQKTLIVFREAIFSLCDFQQEGLTACAMEWSAKAFGFECPKIQVEFDKVKNQYLYSF